LALIRTLLRRLLWAALIIMILGVISAVVVGVYVFQYGQTDRAQAADVIVILGAGTRANGVVSPAYARRINHAVTLYEKGLAPYLICTGGYGSRFRTKTEAQACAEYLQAVGVPSTAIILEAVSRSTEENAIEVAKIMAAASFKTAILVSDDFHLLRAQWLFEGQAVQVFPSPAQATSGRLRYTTAVTATFREVLALGWQSIKTTFSLPFTETPF